MIGAFTIGKKAAKFGYKNYGVRGAVVAGIGSVVGFILVKKGARRLFESNTNTA